MTLAFAILLIHLSSMTPRKTLPWQSGASTPPATQDQGTPPQPAPAKPSATHPAAAKKPVHRKKPTPAGCDAAAPGSSSTTSSATPGSAPAQTADTASRPTNCPPSKIIVSHGGMSEPSIQLAGKPGGDVDSQKRDATTQMLGTTENNLKKLSGQQLSTSQQNSITQIRQFMEQSKSALASGDTERARTLAWKAQVLSEDLVKPQK